MNKKAFTLVELIVVITILAVLATVAFISFQGYAANSRDSVRLADLQSMQKVNTIFKETKGKYPLPNEATNIVFSGATAWTQGVFGKNSYSDTISMGNVPTDPLTFLPYPYSVTTSGQEYQIAAVLENPVSSTISQSTYAGDQLAEVYVKGDYNGQFLKVHTGSLDYLLGVPSILASDINSVDVMDIIDNQRLVYKGYNNLPASYSDSVYNNNGGFAFVPNQVVLFSGDIDDFANDPTARLDFLDSLEANYSGTEIVSEKQIAEILEIKSGSPSAADNYVANILNNSLKTDITILQNNVVINSSITVICPESPNADNDFVFDEGTKTITDYIGTSTDVIIPCKIGGVDVTTLGDRAFYYKGLTSVIIPNNIIELGQYTFNRNNLTSITIPNSVTIIRSQVFTRNQLTSVIIPESVTSIGYQTFASNSLTGLTIPNSVIDIGNQAFMSNPITSVTLGNNITSISSTAFRGNPLSSVVNYDGVVSNEYIYVPINGGIEIVKYFGPSNSNIIIPNTIGGKNVVSIGDNAFSDNLSLTSVTLGNNITDIGNNAFRFHGLTSVMNYDGVTSNEYIYVPIDGGIEIVHYIGSSTNITIPNTIAGKNVVSIGASAFNNKNIASINIPNNVRKIGEGAFGNNDLTTVVIPSLVTKIGGGAFLGNPLSSIVNYDGITSNEYLYSPIDGGMEINDYIGSSTNLIIPNTIGGINVVSIGDSAFSSNSLNTVTIPNTITYIGSNAFSSNSLSSVTIPSNVTYIGEYAFYQNNISTVVIPNNVTEIGERAFLSNNITTVTIPNSVTKIGEGAFHGNNITNLSISGSVSSIGDYAFYSNNLTSSNIIVECSLPTFGRYVFDNNGPSKTTNIPNPTSCTP